MQESIKVDQKLVDSIRKFLVTRWADITTKAAGVVVDEPIADSQDEIYSSFINRLNEFGDGREYVTSLVEKEDTSVDEILLFVERYSDGSELRDN